MILGSIEFPPLSVYVVDFITRMHLIRFRKFFYRLFLIIFILNEVKFLSNTLLSVDMFVSFSSLHYLYDGFTLVGYLMVNQPYFPNMNTT